jgi:DNA helicase HerA-like ATPase
MLSELARWASRNPSRKLQALVLFDEADIYMPAMRKPATKEPMQDLLRRARSAGLGVMLATQSPGDLDYKSRDNIRTWFLGRVAESTAVAKMQPLLSESRVNVKGKLARQSIGEFFMLQGGKVTELKADRSLLDTEQLAEDEIKELAREGLA